MPLPTPAAVPVIGGRLIARQGPPHGTRHAYHRGVDITEPEEVRGDFVTPAYAVGAGDVVDVSPNGQNYQYGNRVIIQHGPGMYSLYAHLHSFSVELGQHVEAGDQVGIVGDTFGTPDNPDQVMTRGAPHLHLELLSTWPDPALGDRWDVLHELAAVGVVLEGDLFVQGDPAEYDEPLLAGIKMPPGEGWQEVVAPLESASPRRHLGPWLWIGGLLFVTAGAAVWALWPRSRSRLGALRHPYRLVWQDPSTGKWWVQEDNLSQRRAEQRKSELERQTWWDERAERWVRYRYRTELQGYGAAVEHHELELSRQAAIVSNNLRWARESSAHAACERALDYWRIANIEWGRAVCQAESMGRLVPHQLQQDYHRTAGAVRLCIRGTRRLRGEET